MMYNMLLEKFVVPLSDKLLGTSLSSQLNYWRSIQYFTQDELLAIQRQKLSSMLQHVLANCPYYGSLGIQYDRQRDSPYDVLQQFPLLTKSIINKHRDDITTKPIGSLIAEKTSGSTGDPVTVYFDKHELSINRAIQIFWWEWAHYQLGNSIFQLGLNDSRGIYKLTKDVLLRTEFRTVFKNTEENILKNLEVIKKKRIQHFGGYAANLYAYAFVAKKHNISSIKFDSVISWGDKMYPHYRDTLESQFSTKVFDSYGACEGVNMAMQCEHGRFHIMLPHVVVEIIDANGNPVSEGETGEVVVTRLDNFSFPLIRYRVGDLAVKGDSSGARCKCGRSMPQIGGVVGRNTEMVVIRDVQLSVQNLAFIGNPIPGMIKYKFIQREVNSLDLEYITDHTFDKGSLTIIQQKVDAELGFHCPIGFQEVDHIPDRKSGKPQVVESLVCHPR